MFALHVTPCFAAQLQTFRTVNVLYIKISNKWLSKLLWIA